MSAVNRYAVRLAAGASPVLLVLLAPSVQESRSPSSASATSAVSAGAEVATVSAFQPPALTPEQVLAMEYLSTRRNSGTAEMPFLRPEQAPEVPATEMEDTAPKDDRPSVALSSIMSGSRPIAMVNGKPMTVGQTLVGDWVLSSIDAKAGVVRFEDRFDSGRFFTAKLHRDLLPGG